ncbi:MAG: YraN family protein [Firmicutes bacterium]|nr:YraN family protein [Bacillota bacterium]
MNRKKKLGMEGEERAAVYLDHKGYELLERNFRCRWGEIDIIALDGETLCFIEVKTRNSVRHGLPAEAVGRRKMMRLQRCAHVYMERFGGRYRDVRFDVVEVIKLNPRRFAVRHLPGGRTA